MSVTKTYARPKSATTNSTGLVLSILVGELPDSPGAIGGTGTTGILDARFQADLDESGGTDLQDVFKVVATPNIAADGTITMSVTITPINGDASAGTPQTLTVTHGQNADVLQTAGGRARQA